MSTLTGLPSLSAETVVSYIQAVQRFPLLSAEQERSLAVKLRRHGDLEAARDLVLSHLRLVVAIARGYLGYGLPHADLIQEGNIGLMKAVKRFDPDRGARLGSYAIRWIKGEIREYVLRNWRLVKVAATKPERKLFFNLRSMKRGPAPLTPAEIERIAAELRVKPEEVAMMETRLSGEELALDVATDEKAGPAPVGYLAADGDAEPLRALELEEAARRAAGLGQALSRLDARSRRIIEARWISEDRKAKLRELAAEFSVSCERIRQIENAALKQLRSHMQAA